MQKNQSHKPPPPKELSSAVKGLRFMARKEETNSTVKKKEANESQARQLPETTERANSIFSDVSRKAVTIVFRRPLLFSKSSDAMAEIVYRERTGKNKRQQRNLGRFDAKKADANDDESSTSSNEDIDFAKHFARNRKRNHQTT